MNVLRHLWLIASVSVLVFFRRLFRGPRVKGWGWGLEMLAATLRHETRRQAPMVPARVRAHMLDAPVPRSVQGKLERTTGVIGDVPVEVLTPHGWQVGGPTVLYLHGGGYVICTPGTHRDLTSRIAVASRARLVVADYRLAPEHPYPAALDDADAVWRALSTEPGPMAVAGDSAGGGLCLGLMLRLREARQPLPLAGALISPWVDLTLSQASIEAHVHDYLDKDALERFAAHYLQGVDPRTPEVSPMLADLTGLPPLLVLTGDAEVFYDEDVRFAAAAESAGVDVTLHVGQGMVHAWPAFAAVLPQGREALEMTGAFLQDRLGESSGSQSA
jgi:acetyl esterase/lipase